MNHEIYDTDDRIAALATPWAESAIGVIRVSGAGSVEAVDSLFEGSLSLKNSDARKLNLGTIRHPETDEVFDEIMAVNL